MSKEKKKLPKTKTFLAFLLASIFACTLFPVAARAASKGSVKLSKTSVTLTAGGKTVVTLKKASKKAGKVIWASTNRNIVTVSGKGNSASLKANQGGKCHVTATYKGRTYKVKVTVLALSQKKLAMTAGQKDLSLSLKGISKKDGRKVKWTTSNAKIVKISTKKGSSIRLTAGNQAGTAKISCRYGKKKFSCKVTVSAPAAQGNDSGSSGNSSGNSSETPAPEAPAAQIEDITYSSYFVKAPNGVDRYASVTWTITLKDGFENARPLSIKESTYSQDSLYGNPLRYPQFFNSLTYQRDPHKTVTIRTTVYCVKYGGSSGFIHYNGAYYSLEVNGIKKTLNFPWRACGIINDGSSFYS